MNTTTTSIALPQRAGRALEADIPFEQLERVAIAFARSGFFEDSREAAQTYTKMLAGREFGLGPMAAMTGIFIVKGKPTMAAATIAGVIKKSGIYNYRVLKHSNTVCELEFFEHGVSVGISEFTTEDATRAGLTSNQTYQKFPKNMMFARALTNGARWYTPDVFGGAIYTPDELQPDAPTNADGTPVKPQTYAIKEVAPVALAPAEGAEVPPTIDELKTLFAEAGIEGITLGAWMEKHVAPDLSTRADPITGKRIAPMPVELCVTRRMLREVIDALAPEPPQQPPHDDPEMTAAIIAKAKAEIAQGQAQMDFTSPPAESVNTEPRTDAQLKKVQIMFRERGMTTEGHRHMFAAALLGEHKRSSKNWTVDDARRMIDRLELIPPRNEAQA